MIGAIAGDIIGAPYEWRNTRKEDFPLFAKRPKFTDDTVLTVATADHVLYGGGYDEKYRGYFRRYPLAGFGGKFTMWSTGLLRKPYNSWGNGSAMRVSPVGFAFDDLKTVMSEAEKSAEVTHNHPEGIKGAQATAGAILLGRQGKSKEEIRTFIEETFGYVMDETVAEIREYYKFDVSCQGTVPQAITAFLESSDWEDAVRKGISLGGDSDTIGCITGGIAEGFYGGVPDDIAEQALATLDEPLRATTRAFIERFC